LLSYAIMYYSKKEELERQSMELRKPDSEIENSLVAALYQRHAHDLFKYIYVSLSRREEAEDILMEVFLAAHTYQGLGRLNERQQFAWLVVVARNKVADWYRTVSARPASSLEQLLPGSQVRAGETSSPEAVALKQEEYALLRSQISRLPKFQQEVLRLRFILEMRHAEIARVLDTTIGSVQTALWRSLRSLRKLYQLDPQGRRTHDRKE
jgi:RNA polymerase sigma factor (sigma-70 family)